MRGFEAAWNWTEGRAGGFRRVLCCVPSSIAAELERMGSWRWNSGNKHWEMAHAGAWVWDRSKAEGVLRNTLGDSVVECLSDERPSEDRSDGQV
jgi:hypothetical protein